MDLSKLPRLSEPEKHAPPAMDESQKPPVPVLPNSPHAFQGPAVAAQVWLAGIIGLVLILFGWSFARFLAAKISGRPFHTGITWVSGQQTGQEVEYFDLQGHTALTDAGLFFFGVAMVLEAVMLATVRRNTPAARAVIIVALSVTVLATALNVVVVALLLKSGILPLISGLAVAYGGYMAIYEWQMLRQLLCESRA